MRIVSYLQGIGLPIEREGQGWKLPECPFCSHRDCFKISPEDYFRCFSCNAAGDVFKFESLRQGISYQEAKRKLTGASTIQKPDPERERTERNHQRLLESPEALKWLTEQRRISIDVIKRFKIGCFTAKDGKVHYSFPYFDGSSVANVKFRTKDKLIYFMKGMQEFLYNRNVLRNNDSVLIVEGEMDCLATYTYRLKVPCLSVGLGAGNVRPEWRDDFSNVRQVYIAFDNDEPGRRGALELAQLLGVEKCRIVRFPLKDLNDCLMQGIEREAIEACLQKSITIDQALIFDAIDMIPSDEPVLGEKIQPILSMIGARSITETEDYLRYFRSRFPQVSFKQIIGFRHEIDRIRQINSRANVVSDEPTTPSIPDDIKNEAIELLKSKDLLTTVQEWLTTLGLVGEDENKVALWIIMVSRLLQSPISAVIFGSSSGGKSHLTSTVLQTINDADVLEYTSLSTRALEFSESSLEGKVIYIQEYNGTEETDYQLRVGQSEGLIRRAFVIKDPETGQLRGTEKTIKVRSSFIVTTTKLSLFSENQNRIFPIYVDDSMQATKRINEFILYTQTMEFKKAEPIRQRIKAVLKAAQQQLKSYEIIIPYASLLTFPATTTRHRRDLQRCLSFIKTIALLRQLQKPVKNDSILGDYLEADVEDYRLMTKFLLPILTNCFDDLSPRTLKVLRVCILLQEEKRKGLLDPDGCAFSVREIKDFADKLNVDLKSDLRETLYELTENEWIEIVSGSFGKRGSKMAWKVSCSYQLDEEGSISNIRSQSLDILTPDELNALIRKNQEV